MKILRVISSTDPLLGGVVEAVRVQAKALAEADVATEIVCCDDPDAPWLTDQAQTVHALGPSKLKYGYTPKLVPWLRKNVTRFDCVLIEGMWQYHSYAAFRVARELNKPYFVFTHGMLDPWFKTRYPLKHLKKWVYWPWSEYRILKHAQKVVFTSDEERKQSRTSFWLYSATEEVIPLGIEFPVLDRETCLNTFNAKFSELKDKRIFLYMGRLHPIKGADLLIKAFAQVARDNPDLVLMLAGPDPLNWGEELKKLAQQQNVSHQIVWPGMISAELKWGAFYSAEIFVLPSHHENFGIVVAEALSCGLPVLISDKVQICNEITAGKAGLVEDDSEDGIVRLLSGWLSQTEEQKDVMKKNALATFKQHFHVVKMVDKLIATLLKNVA